MIPPQEKPHGQAASHRPRRSRSGEGGEVLQRSIRDEDRRAYGVATRFGLLPYGRHDLPCAAQLQDGRSGGQGTRKDWVGTHHFGFWVDDLDAQRKTIESHGGTFFLDLPHDKASLYYEMKFRDPDGVVFDI